MTIAAGFRCRNGVLLCADTEHTGWTSKSHHSKVDYFDIPNGKVCFALAGASALAWSAIQKCKKSLQSGVSGDLADQIESILDAEYRRNVYAHPDYSAMDYRLLVGTWTDSEGHQLYSTTATAMTQIKSFECIGVGAELASYLVRPLFLENDLKETTVIASYAMSCVKESISGCGGMTVHLLLRNDGQLAVLTSDHEGPTKEVEKYARCFDYVMRRALLWMADMQGQDIYFEKNIHEGLVKGLTEKRAEWVQQYRDKEEEFASINPHLHREEAKQMFAEISLGFLPKPPET